MYTAELYSEEFVAVRLPAEVSELWVSTLIPGGKKAHGREDVSIHISLTATIFKGEWSATSLCRFVPGKLWIGG